LPNITAIRVYFRSFIVWIPAHTLLFNRSPESIQSIGLENVSVPFPADG